jgi:hypothetical protein
MNVFDQLKRDIRRADMIGAITFDQLAWEAKTGRQTLRRWLDGTVQFPRLPQMLRVAMALERRVELTGDVRKMVNYHRRLWRQQ